MGGSNFRCGIGCTRWRFSHDGRVSYNASVLGVGGLFSECVSREVKLVRNAQKSGWKNRVNPISSFTHGKSVSVRIVGMRRIWQNVGMQPALTLFWMVAGLSLAIGTVMTIVGLVRAPDGYEDEGGFQYAHDRNATLESRDEQGHMAHPSHPELA